MWSKYAQTILSYENNILSHVNNSILFAFIWPAWGYVDLINLASSNISIFKQLRDFTVSFPF